MFVSMAGRIPPGFSLAYGSGKSLGLVFLPFRSDLPYVSTANWGGLPVTLLLAVLSLGLEFPISVFLALVRRSRNVVPRVPWDGIVPVGDREVRGLFVVSHHRDKAGNQTLDAMSRSRQKPRL
jgi:hypothetical protein